MNVDKEHIISYFQDIIYICEKTTNGNLSHHIATIKGMCTRNIEFIEKYGIEEIS